MDLKEKKRIKIQTNRLVFGQSAALLVRPGVTAICARLEWRAERWLGRSAASSSAPGEPGWPDVKVRLQGDRPFPVRAGFSQVS